MSSALAQPLSSMPLSSEWKDRLDLSNRTVPELYEDPGSVRQGPHANAIRMILRDLNASAVLCVQDVPMIVVVASEEYDREQLRHLHGALWNQGLASLLLQLSGNTMRAFSLARTPYDDDQEFEKRCLIDRLEAVADALSIKDFIYGAESGRLWQRNSDYFDVGERIDQVLLNNLMVSHSRLCKDGLSQDAAQALLIQTMFVAYLEDREIIGQEYFKTASKATCSSFLDLLESTNSAHLERLFDNLRENFNGDLFVAPCSFDVEGVTPPVTPAHMETLARFRDGREVMGTTSSQLRFWGYNFKYIPIELMSAVYDHFLGKQKAQRKATGAFYTPMFLADTVISALWDKVSESTKSEGRFLDPACGSGVFLVRSFQLLCEHWRETHRSQTIRWDTLLRILSRLSGCDVNEGAIRVAVFSLYVALLQEVNPPDLTRLSEEKKLLPQLWDRTLHARDFFQASEEEMQAEVILGNPPWSSRQGGDHSSVTWCRDHQVPMPSNEAAWAFVWKSLEHLADDGVVGLLLPAMGFLHNHANKALQARVRLFEDSRIHRIVNFADLRFQLFEGAVRAAALIIFGKRQVDSLGYRFDYWVPKADLNLKMRRAITLSSVDRNLVTSFDVSEDPFVFKRRLWLSDAEAKLFGYLRALPTLGNVASDYQKAYRTRNLPENRWVVGSGFQPLSENRSNRDHHRQQRSELIVNLPYLPIEAFRVLAQGTEHLSIFRAGQGGSVRRRGFERGFKGSRVLVPRGISTSNQRLRATYTETPLTFKHVILAVSVPDYDSTHAKLLTALLNSKLLYWFAFHGTASFGSDRPELQQADLLRLPFPAPSDLLQEDPPIEAAEELVSIIDRSMASATRGFDLNADEGRLLERLDSHCYSYFGLSDEEIALVEDSVANLIPNAQPHVNGSFDLCQPTSHNQRKVYANTLASNLTPWFEDDLSVCVELEAKNNDLALIRLWLEKRREPTDYRERDDQSVESVLARMRDHIDKPLPGNFQLVPDFRVFIGKSLYLVKPLQRRFWLKASAMSDAYQIAIDLQESLPIRDRALSS